MGEEEEDAEEGGCAEGGAQDEGAEGDAGKGFAAVGEVVGVEGWLVGGLVGVVAVCGGVVVCGRVPCSSWGSFAELLG